MKGSFLAVQDPSKDASAISDVSACRKSLDILNAAGQATFPAEQSQQYNSHGEDNLVVKYLCMETPRMPTENMNAVQDVEAEVLCMRQDLGIDIPEASAADASMRYSRRTRGLRPEDELHEEAEIDMVETRALQQRRAPLTFLFICGSRNTCSELFIIRQGMAVHRSAR